MMKSERPGVELNSEEGFNRTATAGVSVIDIPSVTDPQATIGSPGVDRAGKHATCGLQSEGRLFEGECIEFSLI